MASTVLPSAELIRGRAPILTPTVMTSALMVGSVLATLPLVRLAYAGRAALLPTVTTGLWIMAILSPITAVLKGLLLGGVAWAVVVLTGAQARYRSLVSAVLYGQVILALQGAWVTVLLWLRGTAGLHQPADLMLSTGMDAFVHDPSSVLAAVARCVTPFYCAWFIFLTVAVAQAARRGWWRGAVAAGVLWILVTGLGVTRALVV